ncbi:ABC-type multidrug transport system, ATPase component [Longilinea arvoryzae]|uniref:ABC-type multidrug transport system, ATPase component n=1 Tax=Longilinea arvoryzae TaxID=360412 RepID=A0A0S7BDU9_9CHLR|nr:ABC transporter ATP-binding protein [Longilinea arvoryzae]GAP12550.1 ABC-type multidrug transport system, ATPase component [Longilinea arvoryzae]
MQPQLVVAEISKQYGSFLALAPVSFGLNAGEIALLSGPNGSGKTTLLSCLSGLIRPSTGSVSVAGYDSYHAEVEFRRRLAFVPDVPRFYVELTAWEHLRFIAMAHNVIRDFDARAENILRKLDLWEARDLFPHHYSRGMRLKLGLALALIRPFDVLLLDEPTSALDQQGIQYLLEELHRASNQGASILVSTHDPALFGDVESRRLLIRQGVFEAL